MAANRKSGLAEGSTAFQRGGATRRHEPREVQASVAKTHFSQLLDEVERGATIVIVRHGRPIARIVPDPERRRQEAREALENIKRLGEEIRARNGPISIEEIIWSIHEGHKY